MFLTQILRIPAANITRGATKQAVESNVGYPLGEPWLVGEARRLSKGVSEWIVTYSLVLGWPFAVYQLSHRHRWLSIESEYDQ